MEEINDRVKLVRETLALSQKKFGDTIGLSQTAIYDIERGKCKVTPRNIDIICMKHYVNEEWLKTGQGEMFNKIDEFNRLCQSLSDEDKEYLKPIIKKMISPK